MKPLKSLQKIMKTLRKIEARKILPRSIEEKTQNLIKENQKLKSGRER